MQWAIKDRIWQFINLEKCTVYTIMYWLGTGIFFFSCNLLLPRLGFKLIRSELMIKNEHNVGDVFAGRRRRRRRTMG